MKTIYLLLFMAIAIAITSCGSKSIDQSEISDISCMDLTPSAELSLPSPPPPVLETIKFVPPEIKDDVVESDETADLTSAKKENQLAHKKKIIKDGNISVKTHDIVSCKKRLDAILKTLNAYYEMEDFQNDEQQMSYTLKVRVNSLNFEKLIASIESGNDEIVNKNIQVRDVTEEFIDIESRLANKKEYLKRYKDLLSKASTVKDILEIEENIRVLQEEIESQEGRLKYLNDQVSLSTLDITLSQVKEFVYKPQLQDKFSERVKKSLSNGWSSVVDFVLWVITCWPYLVVIGLLYVVIRRVIKRKKALKP